MDEFTHWLSTLGPYAAPVNLVLCAGLLWLAKDRSRILEELREVREKRIADLQEQADEYREHSEATQAALHRWSEIMNVLLRRGGG